MSLSNQITAAWTKFAKHGNPNGSGNSPWPAFTAPAPKLLQQNLSSTILNEADYRAAYHCDFWDVQS